MSHAISPCLDTFCCLDRLGLTVAAQQVESGRTVLCYRPTTPAPSCPDCAGPGLGHDVVLRRLAHTPLWMETRDP